MQPRTNYYLNTSTYIIISNKKNSKKPYEIHIYITISNHKLVKNQIFVFSGMLFFTVHFGRMALLRPPEEAATRVLTFLLSTSENSSLCLL
ncbi:hypothetical protein OIU79_015523 [Salix purpurea]|uniref:Uncharacterized protein n=1 Tax=Salix purpurea TaxID=77065 RepID=A0A9Q0PCF9_SALPP|nr:hypothetical protein OIU79_015523 [Salix purpurea]